MTRDDVAVPKDGRMSLTTGKAVVAAVVLAGAMTVTAVPASAEGDTNASRTIDWKPCPDNAEVDCGTLTLPINWANQREGTFDLALARRKAKDPSKRIGSVVVDPGGPGGAGAEWIESIGFFSEDVQNRFDIVGFDPRGVTKSHPIICDQSVLDQAPTTDLATEQGYADRVAYNRKLADNCRQNSGPLYDHVDNLSVVRDIDAIRAALGEKKLNYWGVSYGTIMGQQYAELFPNRIRTLVLDSNMDHSRSSSEFFTTEAKTDEDSFDQFAKWCDSSTKCALHGQDVGALFDKLYGLAQQGKLSLTPDQLSQLALGHLYRPSWTHLATRLKALADGTQSRAAAEDTKDTEDNKMPFYDMAAFCSDWKIDLHSAEQVAAQRKSDAKAAPHLQISGLAWNVGSFCIGRTTPVQNPQRPYEVFGAPPILMVNSLYDPATPYAWATNVAKQIPSATLVTYEGWGHSDYNKSPCVSDITDQYLITTKVPAKNTHCAAVPPKDGTERSAPVLPKVTF
jgi:pimeloyl-ACP methyl ester carboxylesterase